MSLISRIFVDTNILVEATDSDRTFHIQSLSLLESGWSARRLKLYSSTQVWREYLVVATRPTASNGMGLSPTQALNNIAEFRKCIELVPESIQAWEELARLVEEHRLVGKRIHDANLVTTARLSGINTILTINTKDFVSLPITAIHPEDLVLKL